MNKIYRVIWSRAKHCYVVVSEMAKNRTKSHGSHVVKKNCFGDHGSGRIEPVRNGDAFLCGG